MIRTSVGFSLCLALLSCDGSVGSVDAGPADVVRPDAWPPPALRLGIGGIVFADLTEGQTLELMTGCQGSQHIFVSLRATHLEPSSVRVELSLRRVADGVRVSEHLIARYPASTVDGQPEAIQLSALLLVIPDPAAALGHELVLDASVEDVNGAYAEASARVQIAWGPDPCGL